MGTRWLLFGKLPAHGDFVSRGLKPAERDELDRWLSASLTDARDAYGDGFEDRYDAAVPWRFANQGDDGWTAGAVAMSADGAGRRFPIFAVREGLSQSGATIVAAAAEALLFRAITEGWSADTTLAALEATPCDDGGEFAQAGWWVADDGTGQPARRLDGRRPADLARAMLAPFGSGAAA